MPDLVNELTWSFGRASTFNECRRKYYWRYYHFWNGWDPKAPPDVRQAYILGKMTNADMFVGTVAHKAIAFAFQGIKSGLTVHFERLERQIDGMLRSGVQASRMKEWKLNPKEKPNFFEDYYGRGISDEKLQDLINKANTAVSNFLKSSSFRKLTDPRVKLQWLATDHDKSFSFFHLDDIKVLAEPDLAVKIKDKCYLFDWKTGKPSGEHDRQLTCYALYACSEWHVQPENVVARAVYLHQLDRNTGEPHERPVPYDESIAEDVRDYIRRTYGEMAKIVTEDNVADIGAFPKCEREGLCKRCQFQELCS